MQVQGQVQDIKAKPTKIGDMYDIKVNGDYYGMGKYPPRDIKAGDYVEFVMEQNGNFRNVGRGTLRKIEAPAGASSTPPVRQAVGMTYDEKQSVISKQAALNTAIAMVKLAVDAGVVTLPAKKAEAYDALEAMVIEQASRFHNVSTGHPFPAEATSAKSPARTPAKKAAQPAPPVGDEEWVDDELPE